MPDAPVLYCLQPDGSTTDELRIPPRGNESPFGLFGARPRKGSEEPPSQEAMEVVQEGLLSQEDTSPSTKPTIAGSPSSQSGDSELGRSKGVIEGPLPEEIALMDARSHADLYGIAVRMRRKQARSPKLEEFGGVVMQPDPARMKLVEAAEKADRSRNIVQEPNYFRKMFSAMITEQKPFERIPEVFFGRMLVMVSGTF